MELIPASRFTIEGLTDAYNQTRVDYLVPMPMTAKRLQEYVDVYDVDLDASVVAMDGEEMLGLCMLGLRAERAWITRLGVLPASRRRGTGLQMMEYEIEQARERGVSTVYLEVITGNAPAHRLFVQLGFVELRSLLILRRPPTLTGEPEIAPDVSIEWIGGDEVLALARTVNPLPAWTNQAESLHNAGAIRGLLAISHNDEAGGWLSYEKTALQLKRITMGTVNGNETIPAGALLSALHHEFPRLDTIAENIPDDDPNLNALLEQHYVESFSRIEMSLQLK